MLCYRAAESPFRTLCPVDLVAFDWLIFLSHDYFPYISLLIICFLFQIPLEMRSLNFNVRRSPFQETLDPQLDIMTSLGPPKRYFASGPTEPLSVPARIPYIWNVHQLFYILICKIKV